VRQSYVATIIRYPELSLPPHLSPDSQQSSANHRTLSEIVMTKCLALTTVCLAFSANFANAQVELSKYANANGYIMVKELTCAQLSNTYQEDADFLGVWYSGWYNGLAKKSAINVPRVKEGIHNVIVYCKANQDKKIIQAIDAVMKAEKAK
jgi:hypothetical protein